MITNCTSASGGQNALRLDPGELMLVSSKEPSSFNALTAEFQKICLSGKTSPLEWGEIANENSWTQANTNTLHLAGLAPLEKTVLSIPGGGGRFDEAQTLLARGENEELAVLDLEQRLVKGKIVSSGCTIYGRSDYLKACESLGKLLNRVPDHNQRYPDRGAQFIRWNAILGKYPATVSCNQAPQSPTLPYDGIYLMVEIDHQGEEKSQPIPTSSNMQDR